MAFERIHPGTAEWDAYYANHIHRYMFAAQRLPGAASVLDAACGVGYGSQWLAQEGAGAVIAVDRDERALHVARESFSHDRVRFLRDDCQVLAEAGRFGPFDAIVSFETLEHLPRPADFLRRCRELLVPGGQLIISTPNAGVTGGQGPQKWAYHEKEYTAREAIAVIEGAGFSGAELFGQQYTPIGRLRSAVRAEANRLRSNPLIRLGSWMQQTLRGRPGPGPALPEHLDDFEIIPLSAHECERLGTNAPFVLIYCAPA